VVTHLNERFDPEVSLFDGLLVSRQVTIDNEKVRIGPDRVLDEPFQTLCSVPEVSVFLDVYIAAMGDLHLHSTPSKEHFVGPTLVNKNHSKQEDDGHDDVGKNQ
jgi:hypothetical protein